MRLSEAKRAWAATGATYGDAWAEAEVKVEAEAWAEAEAEVKVEADIAFLYVIYIN
jgi:hypothetical protein